MPLRRPAQAFDEEDEKLFGDHFSAKEARQAVRDAEPPVSEDEDEPGATSLLDMLDASLSSGKASAPASRPATQRSQRGKQVGSSPPHGDGEGEEGEGVDLLAMVRAIDGKAAPAQAPGKQATPKHFWSTVGGGKGDSEFGIGAGDTAADQASGMRSGTAVEASQGAAGATGAAAAAAQLSLASLLRGLDEESQEGAGRLKGQLAAMASTGGPIAAPVGSVTQARAEREVAYAHSKRSAGRWQDVVAANRAAPSISFTHEVRAALKGVVGKQTAASLRAKFTPETELEAEVSALLAAAGMEGEAAVAASEATELGEATVTPAEAAKRRNQLAKLRALMFYDEKKKARANKTKSRAFRKVLKRKRIREAEAVVERMKSENPEMAAQLEEEAAAARAKARISQRHRARSKWVRKALAMGGTEAATAAYKADLNAHLARAAELTAKINARPTPEAAAKGAAGGNSSSDDDDSDASSLGGAWELREGAEADEADAATWRKAAASLRAEAEDVSSGGEEGQGGPAAKGLMGLKFMQRGAAERRAVAKAALQEAAADAEKAERRAARRAAARREGRDPDASEEEEGGQDSDAGTGSAPGNAAAAGRRSFGGSGGKGAVVTHGSGGPGSAAAEAAAALGKGQGLQVGQVARSAQSRTAVAGAITVPGASGKRKASSYVESLAAAGGAWLEGGGEGEEGDSGAGGPSEDSSNPWLVAAKGGAEAGGDSDSDEGEGWTDLTATMADSARLASRAGMRKGTSSRLAAAATAAATAGRGLVDVEGALASLGGSRKRPRSQAPEHTTPGTSSGEEGQVEDKEGSGRRKASRGPPTQEELVRRAFVADTSGDVEAELEAEKEAAVQAALPRHLREGKEANAGWGSWTGLGSDKTNATAAAKALARRAARKRKRSKWLGDAAEAPRGTLEERKAAAVTAGRAARSDTGLKGVVLSQKRDRKLASKQAPAVPFPFTSAEQYERSLRAPLGPEWNTSAAVEEGTRPEVALRRGMMVAPIASAKVQSKGDDTVLETLTTSVSVRGGNVLAPHAALTGKKAPKKAKSGRGAGRKGGAKRRA